MTPPPDPPTNRENVTIAQTAVPAMLSSVLDVPGYEIVGELGRGGMGVVYKARQVGLNRIVAIKTMTGSHVEQHELLRFQSEAEALAAVHHPHVVPVFEIGRCAGRPYFAMEYLGGGSLANLIRAGRLAPMTSAALMEKVSRGVQAAHDLGIVHRDLKPQNVLLGDDGEPKVADFGIAKRTGGSDLTQTGAVMGTPSYMAPEQATGRTKFVGPAADVYTLGVILYECLTGRPPFTADDTVRLLTKVAEDDPPPIRESVPAVSRDLEAICLKCLRKEPNARYATAEDLADDLRRFLNGEPVTARATGGLGMMVGALDRSLKDVEFAAYGSCTFWVAGIMLAGEVLVFLALSGVFDPWAILFIQWGRIGAFLGTIWWFRGRRLLPATGTERQLWSLCGGYILCCLANSIGMRLGVFGIAPENDMYLYQPLAALTALLFFSLGSILWGWCYAFGLAFLACGFVMAIDLKFAPLLFGSTWAIILIVIGTRLKRLAHAASLTRTSGTQP